VPLSHADIADREQSILAGLYLSKYDSLALKSLGFDNFQESFNALGYALGSRPASIKNYRDEFDPHFPNARSGWRNRPMRAYCRAVLDRYGSLDFESFTGLVRSFFLLGSDIAEDSDQVEASSGSPSSFASRLITGLAAERYFERLQPQMPDFQDYVLENTTQWGCGYDFRLTREGRGPDFLAVEVKGLKARSGTISMTPKEYGAASQLRERFYLFVVRNFVEAPSHSVYCNPLQDSLSFRRVARTIVQTSWLSSV